MSKTAAIGMPKLEAGPQKSVGVSHRSVLINHGMELDSDVLLEEHREPRSSLLAREATRKKTYVLSKGSRRPGWSESSH